MGDLHGTRQHGELPFRLLNPLEDAVLLYATLDDTLSSTDLTNLLLSHSPLSPEVLEAARTRDVPLDAGDLSVVEASQ